MRLRAYSRRVHTWDLTGDSRYTGLNDVRGFKASSGEWVSHVPLTRVTCVVVCVRMPNRILAELRDPGESGE